MSLATVLPAQPLLLGPVARPRSFRRTRVASSRRWATNAAAAAADTAPPPPAPAELAALLACASDAAHRAARLCVAVRSRFDAGGAAGGSLSKADATPVTVADFGVQALLSLQLGAAFPEIPLVAEEDAAALRQPDAAPLLAQVLSAVQRCAAGDAATLTPPAILAAIDRGTAGATGAPRRWVLDPIDGTKGFLRGGAAQYAVGLALLDDHAEEPLLGVLALPNWQLAPASPAERGVVLVASRGGGAWVRRLEGADAAWEQARCDNAAALADATVCVSDHETWADTAMAAAAAPKVPSALLPLCCGSLVKYAAVALGHASLFVQHPVPGVHRLKAWDHAAGVAVVLGAGGRVVDFSARPVSLGTGREFIPAGLGVLVSNAPICAAALALLPRPGRRPQLVLLDRDGCINVDLGTWILRPDLLRLLPGAASAVAALNAAGCTTAVVTNQSCLGRGMLSPAGLHNIHAEMAVQLAAGGASVDAIFVAPDDPDGAAPVSSRRKPGPGMLLEAMALYGVNAERCAMVGDTVSDMRAAVAAGVSARYLVCTGHGERYAVAATAQGVTLPVTLRPSDTRALAQLLPPDVLPLELHADLASATAALLASAID